MEIKEFFQNNAVKKSILVIVLLFTIVSSIFATMCNASCDDSKQRGKGLLHGSYPWIIICVFLLGAVPKIGDSDGLFNILFVLSVCVGIIASSFALECSVGCKDPDHKNNSKTNEAAYGIAGFTLSFSVVFGLLVAWANFS
jgi:hypothetical protein